MVPAEKRKYESSHPSMRKLNTEIDGEPKSRYFEIFGKQADFENKVREILRRNHVASDSCGAP